MKLNGWHRLWILLSSIYFVLVTSYVILEFPKPENIPHQPEFYKKLSKKSAGMIWSINVEEIRALGGTIVTNFKPIGEAKEDDNIRPTVEMPNKHTIEFKEEYKKEAIEAVSSEYWHIVEQKATEKRLYILLYAFLFWLFPCLALYALGWSFNWVREGFRQKKDAQQKNRGDRE